MSGTRSLISTRRLDQQSEKTRTRSIPWEGYERAGLISQEDAAKVQKVSSPHRRDGQAKIFAAEPETYATLLVRLLGNLSRNDTLHCVLVLLSDLIHLDDDVPSRIPYVLNANPYTPLIKLTEYTDEFIRNKSLALLATILSLDPSPSPKPVSCLLETSAKLLPHSTASSRSSTASSSGNHAPPPPMVTSNSNTSTSASTDDDAPSLATQALGAVLVNQSIRQKAWSLESEPGSHHVLQLLADLIRMHVSSVQNGPSPSGSGHSTPSSSSDPSGSSTSLSPQMQYQIGVVFWLMSFEPEFCKQAGTKYGLVHLLVEIAKFAVKEKVVRIVLATFRNLVKLAPTENLALLLQAQALPFVRQLSESKKWKDDEVIEDTEALLESLNEARKALTTWDEYLAELSSGQLSWTPPHESPEFWKENASKVSGEPFKKLVKLLKTSTNPLALSVSANDIASYIRYNDPAGKRDALNNGVKERAMDLLSHQDGDVKWRALLLTQRLISQPWSSIS